MLRSMTYAFINKEISVDNLKLNPLMAVDVLALTATFHLLDSGHNPS